MYINIVDNIHFIYEHTDKKIPICWLNLNDGKAYIKDELENIYNFDTFEETEMFEKGYVAFPCISFINTQRKFIEELNDKQLSKKLLPLLDENFSSKFWEYIDDGGYMLSRWYQFLNSEKAKLLIDWCNLNNIKYRYR